MIPSRIPSSRNSSNDVSGTPDSKLPIVSFVTAVFLALMTFKFLPANTESPFETHALIMSMFVVTILVYAMSLCMSCFPVITSNISSLSGSLAPLLLALVLLPYLGWFILVIWVMYGVKLIWNACPMLCLLYNTSSSVSEFFNHLLSHLGHQETIRDHSTSSNNARHAILGFPIVVLVALMPLKFQSMNLAAPFKTHSAVMWTFVIATLVYVLAWVIEAKLGTGRNSYRRIIISKISFLSASLATGLLVLVIVPALGLFMLLVWTLLLAKLLYAACQKLRQLYQAMSTASDVLNEVLGRGIQPDQHRIVLPV
ncbi:hypothetical protein DITRI_Ditri09bG0150600 [Diplodiscus trichospermus]